MAFMEEGDREIVLMWELLETKIMKRGGFYPRLLYYLAENGYLKKDYRVLCATTGHGTLYSILLKRGYDVYGNDGSAEMIKLLEGKGYKHKHKPTNLKWQELANHYQEKFFDFIFTEGNSLIYAGSWGRRNPDLAKAREEINKSILSKSKILKTKGFWYLEIPKESEKGDGPVSKELIVGGKSVTFSYSFLNDWKRRIRTFVMKFGLDGEEVVQKSPLMTDKEFREVASPYFSSIKKLDINDPHYQGYLLRK